MSNNTSNNMINPQLAMALFNPPKGWQTVWYEGALQPITIPADSDEAKRFTAQGGNPRKAANLTEIVIDEKGEPIERAIEMTTFDWVQFSYPDGNADGKLPRHFEDLDIPTLEKKAAEMFAAALAERDKVLKGIVARLPKAGSPLKEITTEQRDAIADLYAIIKAKYGGEQSDSFQCGFWNFTPSKVWVNWAHLQANGTVAAPPNIADIPPTPPFRIVEVDGWMTV